MPDSVPPPAARSRRWLTLALRLLLTGVALGWLASVVDPAAALSRLASAPPAVLLVPPGLLLVNSALHALRLKVLMGGAGPTPPFHRLLIAFLKASFFGLVLPSGGTEVAKVGFLRQEVGRTDLPLAALLVARLLELIPWTALLLWGLAWGMWARDPFLAASATTFICIFSAVLVVAGLAVSRGPRVAGLLPGRVGRFALDVARAIDAVRSPGRLLLAGLLALPFALNNALIVFALVRAYALPLALSDVLALVPAADTLISLPVTVSGLGVREGVFVHILEPWGASEATAVAIGVLRWSGELVRALLGGLLFAFDPGPRPPAAAPGGMLDANPDPAR